MLEKRTALLVHGQPISENEQISLALSPQMMGPLLEQVFQVTNTEGQGRPLECHILDVKYEPGDYCTILYQLGDDLVTGIYQWDPEKSQIPNGTKAIPSLGMRVYRFPN